MKTPSPRDSLERPSAREPLRVMMLVFPLQARGGTVVHLRQWLQALCERSVRVFLLYSSPDEEDGMDLELPCQVARRRVDARRLAYLPVLLPAALLEALRTFQPHLLHSVFIASDLVALFSSLFTGLPVVSSLEGALLAFGLPQWKRRVLGGTYRILAQRLSALTVLSRQAAEEMRPMLPPLFHGPDILPLGIHAPADVSREETTPFPHLLYVGRLVPVKALPFLIEVVANLRGRLPNLSLTLLGDGEERASLERLVDRLNLRSAVTFTGWLHPSSVLPFYGRAHLLVLPSHSEGLPWTALEAMARGLPVIATPVGGLPDLLKVAPESERTGFLLEGHDVCTWVQGLGELLEAPDARRRLREVGRRAQAGVKERYALESEIEGLVNIYLRVVRE